jgi:hypothetical protein
LSYLKRRNRNGTENTKEKGTNFFEDLLGGNYHETQFVKVKKLKHSY